MRRAFTLLELLVVIAIVGVLTGLLLPAIGSAMQTGKRVACQANLRSLGQTLQMYLDANRDKLPVARYFASVNTTDAQPFTTLADFIQHPLPQPAFEVESFDPWHCPSDPGLSAATGFSYTYAPVTTFSILPDNVAQSFWKSPRTVIFIDADEWHPGREHERRNVVRRDGSVGLFTGSLNQ